MWEELLGHLDSDQPRTRTLGWKFLHTLIAEEHFVPTREQIVDLQQRVQEETDGVTWKAAMLTLSALALLGPSTRWISEWFWNPFKQPSVVFRVIDPDRLRDEDAVMELARTLCRHEFPQTMFVRVPLEDTQWRQRLELTPRTVCIVGRLGIYGERAVKEFDTNQTRFFFPDQQRPADVPLGAIDSNRFHRILQRHDGQPVGRSYLTSEKNEVRTDYALVQRYYQSERKRFVFLFAGSSTLGTLGAVRWAADLATAKIPLPELALDDLDTLEAVVKVTAPLSVAVATRQGATRSPVGRRTRMASKPGQMGAAKDRGDFAANGQSGPAADRPFQ